MRYLGAVITSRPAASLGDLQAAGDLLGRAWLAGAPFVAATPGDLAWWFAQAWPSKLSEHLRLWSADSQVVAWTWVDGSEFDAQVWSGHRALDEAVERAILAWAIEEASVRAGLNGDGTVEAWAAAGDGRTTDLLRSFGFDRAPVDQPYNSVSQFLRSVDDPARIPDRRLPTGYRIRSVGGSAELKARVAVHRAAFAPSQMTLGKYERLIGLPAYRFDDDLVVEAPDGSLAAFAIAWWDPVARVGDFEPVGTHPDHRRRGLGAALITYALGRYAVRGARLVQVYSDTANAAAEALYQSVGFQRGGAHLRYRRPPDLTVAFGSFTRQDGESS